MEPTNRVKRLAPVLAAMLHLHNSEPGSDIGREGLSSNVTEEIILRELRVQAGTSFFFLSRMTPFAMTSMRMLSYMA